MNMLWWIFCGAAGLWIGMPNPVASFPAAALLYPASLFLLGTGSTSWKHAFRLGWLCGLAGASACLYWLAIPVHDFGGLPWALAAPCPLLMGAYIGLYGGLFAALAHALRGEQAWRKGVALGLGWYLMECFRGWFFTGFPWITLASAFTPWTPVIQLASVIGAYGLGGLLAGLSCLCVEGILRVRHPHALRKRWLPALGGSLAGIFLVVAFGVFSLSFAPSGQGGLWVSLEQGNLDQNVKWEPAMQRLTVKRYFSLSAESLSVPESERPELLIWPETAMPFDYQTAPELSAAIRAFARDRRVALLFGAPGLGKTFLSACIARTVSESGFSVVYDTAVNIFTRFEEQKFARDRLEAGEAKDETRRYLGCDLLILDDLGSELSTPFVQSALYTLINTRLTADKRTVISSNLTMDQVRARYTPQIASRLEGEYRVLPFYGEDIRLLRKQTL